MDGKDAGISFLLTELELASTFLDIADTARDEGKRSRNIANARKAYDTVKHYAARFKEQPEHLRIEQALAHIKKRLDNVG